MPAKQAFETLKTMIESGNYSDSECLTFLDHAELFDQNYNKEEISAIYREFMTLADEYLSTKEPGAFIMFKDWSVHVATLKYGRMYLSDTRAYLVCR